MSDDLVKKLRLRVAAESDDRVCMSATPNYMLHREAADRIETLTDEVMELLAQSIVDLGKVQDAEAEVAALKAKLAEAVEELEKYSPKRLTVREARATLAKLKEDGE
jgi:chromosome segregation ATPase